MPKVREVIRLLQRDGWVEQKGSGTSHRQFEHPTKPGKVTVAGKPGVMVPIGTWLSIQRQAGWRA